jgi:hypothetical protein
VLQAHAQKQKGQQAVSVASAQKAAADALKVCDLQLPFCIMISMSSLSGSASVLNFDG